MVTPATAPATTVESPAPGPSASMEGSRGTYYLFEEVSNAEAKRFCGTLWAMATALVQVPESRITVLINSGGGSVGAGFAMIEMMYKVKRELGIPVDTVILGYAYSMGATIFQAGDHRSMGYFSTMMLHSSSWQVSGRDSEVFKDLKKLSDLYQGMTAELFFRRTELHSAQWWQHLIYSGTERYLSAQECLKLRLVDEVCQFLDECYRPTTPSPTGGKDE
ncbi:MAG: ATP-dependent Clp protease proteolytic subunit [Chloroflexi bacterium]|nr:ATP-dependent Clp protease proteolytic subunit [Chloroflexota bacterium]